MITQGEKEKGRDTPVLLPQFIARKINPSRSTVGLLVTFNFQIIFDVNTHHIVNLNLDTGPGL
ncbi:MAG: hypothetical protein AMR96_02470 [Candidatus Adiutrix intracellularis]|nr:MAG: hypothetical protein AMR96_02470 [Candidatus Adiutrix intracellularis]